LKPVLAVVAFLGIVATFVAMGTPQGPVAWCHFPPGQWDGSRLTSPVQIIELDPSGVNGHKRHAGDGPVDNQPSFPPGFQTGLGPDCSGCGMATATPPSGGTAVQLMKQDGKCVCPPGTSIGNMPFPLNVPTGTSPNLSCGTLQ